MKDHDTCRCAALTIVRGSGQCLSLNPEFGKRTSGYWSHRHCGAQIVFKLTCATLAQVIVKNVGWRFAAWRNLSTN
jgi:hypothetical protein